MNCGGLEVTVGASPQLRVILQIQQISCGSLRTVGLFCSIELGSNRICVIAFFMCTCNSDCVLLLLMKSLRVRREFTFVTDLIWTLISRLHVLDMSLRS